MSFLIKGHTHFDPDQVFSRISVKLDTNNAFCPSSFKSHLESVRNYVVTWHDVTAFLSSCYVVGLHPKASCRGY